MCVIPIVKNVLERVDVSTRRDRHKEIAWRMISARTNAKAVKHGGRTVNHGGLIENYGAHLGLMMQDCGGQRTVPSAHIDQNFNPEKSYAAASTGHRRQLGIECSGGFRMLVEMLDKLIPWTRPSFTGLDAVQQFTEGTPPPGFTIRQRKRALAIAHIGTQCARMDAESLARPDHGSMGDVP